MINLSQYTRIVYAIVCTKHAGTRSARTIPSCLSCERGDRGRVERLRDMENVILVAEEEPRRVLQAWDVGREVWV